MGCSNTKNVNAVEQTHSVSGGVEDQIKKSEPETDQQNDNVQMLILPQSSSAQGEGGSNRPIRSDDPKESENASEIHEPIVSLPSNCHERLAFVETYFTKKCSIGNVNIDTKNVVFLKRAGFFDKKYMQRYEDVNPIYHVSAKDLKKEDKTLFVSHRWQDAMNGNPDDNNQVQYKIVEDFLKSDKGLDVTAIWLDYSCIDQDFTRPDFGPCFRKKLDNIQTAISLCDVVVVVPRIATESEGHTDLNEITARGWCLFEAVTAMMADCTLYVTFTYGTKQPNFLQIAPGLSHGSPLTFEHIQQVNNDLGCKSYDDVIYQLLDEEESLDLPDEVKANWESIDDPAEIAERIHNEVENADNEKQLVSLTLGYENGDGVGYDISSLLPNFTKEADRLVVVNLFGNVSRFCCTGFKEIKFKSQSKLQSLAQTLSIKDEKCTLSLEDRNLFPNELDQVLSIAIDSSQQHFGWELSLDMNIFGYNGANHVVSRFIGRTILKASLKNNAVGDEGAKALSRSNIIELDLTSNIITNEGAEALAANSTLTTLNLSQNGIKDDGAKDLAANKVLTTLILRDNVIWQDGAEALLSNTTLTSLDLQGNGIDQEVEALAENTTLISLNLSGCCLGFSLTKNTTLKTLLFSSNNAGDEGCEQLAQNTSITTLILQNNGIYDAGAKHLSKNRMVTRLDLSDNDISDWGCKALARMSNLVELDLSKNDINDSGVKALARLQNVSTLKLSGNHNISADAIRLLAHCSTFTSLDLADNIDGVPDAVQDLARNSTLTYLNISNCELNGNEHVHEFSDNVSIKTLNLDGCRIYDEPIQRIAKNSSITSLNLTYNSVDIDGIKALAKNSTLTDLNLSFCSVGDEGAKALADNSTITSLNIAHGQVGNEGAKALSGNSTLVHLDVSGTNYMEDEGAIALSMNTTLATLNLSENQNIEAKGFSALANTTSPTLIYYEK